MNITNRVFVSFDEPCPYQCKHCYTYGIERERIRTAEEIVDGISNDEFDIIYVSQKNDNFSNPQKGLSLCRMLFERYNCNLFIITRNVFDDQELKVLENLKLDMQNAGKHIFVAISLNSLYSIDVCENVKKVPTPKERINFMKELSGRGFFPILMLRPIFPDKIIPVKECLEIIDYLYQYISCVVASGLGINCDILNRLGMKEADFTFNSAQEYLQGAIDCEIKFIDVDYELDTIRQKCKELHVPMFAHSMPALNYIIENFT